MKSKKLEDWLQIIGLFSVVGSLIFVGLQMKQAHEIALAEIWQARTTAVAEANLSVSSNEMLVSALMKEATGRPEEITPSEEEAGYWLGYSQLTLWENSLYQNSLGFLPDEHWQRSRAGIKRLLRDNPLQGRWIRRAAIGMQPSFRAVIDEIERELADEAGS